MFDTCDGCTQGIENQQAHIRGCLCPVFDIDIEPNCIAAVDRYSNPMLKSGDFTEYELFSSLVEIIESFVADEEYAKVYVTTTTNKIFDILSGKCNFNIPYYSFYLRFNNMRSEKVIIHLFLKSFKHK